MALRPDNALTPDDKRARAQAAQEDVLLREVNIELMTGNLPGVRKVVAAHCQRQATEPPNISLDDRFTRKWQRVVQWLS